MKPTAIQKAPTSLTRAITTAETRAGGKAKEAEISRGGDQLIYKVEVVKLDGTSEKVEINGSDGKVASAK
ncbi:MAG TPA: PepSY domain-containing protein [Steroidobacteraceae bacterium]